MRQLAGPGLRVDGVCRRADRAGAGLPKLPGRFEPTVLEGNPGSGKLYPTYQKVELGGASLPSRPYSDELAYLVQTEVY